MTFTFMCFIKPLKIIKFQGKSKVILENGIQAIYDKKIGKINVDDTVLVYGNLIIKKVYNHEK